MKNTNTQEIKEMVDTVKQVAEKKEYVEEYKVGDEYILNTEVYKVVEVLGNGDYHLNWSICDRTKAAHKRVKL